MSQPKVPQHTKQNSAPVQIPNTAYPIDPEATGDNGGLSVADFVSIESAAFDAAKTVSLFNRTR